MSFRGMEIAKLLTEYFIKNQETPPAQDCLVVIEVCLCLKRIGDLGHTSNLSTFRDAH